MQLVIDIGNTLTKYGLFNGVELIRSGRTDDEAVYLIKEIYEKEKTISSILISSVNTKIDADLVPIPETIHHVIFDYQTPLPVKNGYQQPETLGLDRIAGAVAGHFQFPGQPVLVIDTGTCLTLDFIDSSGMYQGGSISPGLRLRLQSMHDGTANLPLIKKEYSELPHILGRTTIESMESGAVLGMLHEINGTIAAFQERHHDLQVVLTGGNASLFESGIKSTIFADPNFVLRGLNQILLYNLPSA